MNTQSKLTQKLVDQCHSLNAIQPHQTRNYVNQGTLLSGIINSKVNTQLRTRFYKYITHNERNDK